MAEIDKLFKLMVEADASDLHLGSGARPHLRVHGSMTPIEDTEDLTSAEVMALVTGITPKRNLEEFREHNDTDFAYQIGHEFRFRCNLYQGLRGPGAVFRIIPTELRTCDDLELSEPIRALCGLPKGLVLVTGPTGSGKSTTLAALVDEINRTRTDHIVTIEDPIEFIHPNKKCVITQREVSTHTANFKSALRAALREDPDVVLIGELRDLETMEIALETAETGHLVLGTLHTTTAAQTVDRIIDQYPADRQEQIRTMLSTTLRAVVSQILMKRADGRARVAAFEILMVNSAIAALIREGKTYQIPSMIQTGGKLGMQLQNSAMQRLIQRRLVTFAEAMSKTVDREGLERLMPDEAMKFNAGFGREQTYSAELGMPVASDSSSRDDDSRGRSEPRRSEGGAGTGGVASAAIRKAAAEQVAAQQAAAESESTGGRQTSDDFDLFRSKLAERKKRLKG